MKVKNIVFSGFAAAILVGVCGNADAAAVTFASQGYVDRLLETKQNVLTAGEGIQITDQDVIVSTIDTSQFAKKNEIPGLMETFATDEELEDLKTQLQNQIQELHKNGDYASAQDLESLRSAVEALQSNNVDKTVVDNLKTSVEAIAADYVKKSELTAAEERLDAAIKAIVVPTIPTLVSAFENDAGYITSAALADYAKTADVNAALASKADASDLAKVATTGSYADLEDKPTIPSIEGLASSQDLTNLQTALEAEIAKKQDAGDYAALADMTAAKAAIEELKTGKADASTVATLQESISKLGDTYATDTELSNAIAAIDLTPFAKVTDVESALASKENAANKVATATAEQIEAMSSEDKATKYPSISVAQTIANAAVVKVNEVAGDLSTLQTQVGTNTADIAEIKAAGYQTSDDVQGAITTATADLAAKADVYTKAQVDTAIGAIKEYDDTALAARVSTNETNIAKNTSGIATNASAIAELRDAGFVAGAKTAGSYLVNFDASGEVSYASVEIVDDKGNPIDLTTGAIN